MGKQEKPTTQSEGKEYSGPGGIIRDSVWLTNEDIPHTKDTIVTIEKVLRFESVVFGNQHKAGKTLALTFVGASRMLRVNATMKRGLNRLGGDNSCACWKGLRISLYVKQNVRYADGTYGPAIRMRPELPPPPKDQADNQVRVEQSPEDEIDAAFDAAAKEAQQDG